MTPNIHYDNREIEGERLELTDRTAIYWLGPHITLRRCHVVLGIMGRWLSLVSGQLIDCTIEAKRELSEADWTAMELKGCRFKGRFSGNEFGHRRDYMDKPTEAKREGVTVEEFKAAVDRFDFIVR